MARANRDFLRSVYAVVKDSDAHVRFTFLTGVSKFSKVSLFSGLNNLTDITLDPRFSAVCGYTDADLDTVFAAELPGLDRDEIRRWYNGYNWLGEESVYNPYDILLLLRNRKFDAWWFETGTPSFLIDTLLARGVGSISLDGMAGSADLLSSFDVDHIATEALLFQTGYLTIAGVENLGGKVLYRLGYPNREVRQSLNERLLRAMTPEPSQQGVREIRLYRLLRANDFTGLRTFFEAFFAGIPHDCHRKGGIARYEGYYASVFYSHFAALGLDRRGGGGKQPRPSGHGGPLQRSGLPVRVQGGGAGARGRGDGAVEGEGLRGPVPRPRSADPSDRGGVQPGGAERRRVRGGAGLIGGFRAFFGRRLPGPAAAFGFGMRGRCCTRSETTARRDAGPRPTIGRTT